MTNQETNYHHRQKTSLHSIRMRTARALTVSPSMLCRVGCVPVPGGCLLRGVPAPSGVVSQHALRQTPSVDIITDACKTLPCPNFVTGGNNDDSVSFQWVFCLIVLFAEKHTFPEIQMCLGMKPIYTLSLTRDQGHAQGTREFPAANK